MKRVTNFTCKVQKNSSPLC